MKLYSRDYCVEPTKSEISEYEEILKEEKANARIGRKILYYKYPEERSQMAYLRCFKRLKTTFS